MIITALLLVNVCSHAQSVVADKSMRYQEERMVFKQWDQKKFTPTSGFLGLNPWYWLTWGWFYPNYHKTDLRPLSANGPQTQRLAMVASMKVTDDKYKLQSDTVRNTALAEMANQSGLVTGADPLWMLYYSNEFRPVLNSSKASMLSGISPRVSTRLISEGLFDWYSNELARLKERINGAHSADMDRGSRIMAYHRLLLEYRKLSAVWAVRTSSAAATLDLADQRQRLQAGQFAAPQWTPGSDLEIARKVLLHVK